MRILMTTDAVGGVWNFSLELARGLRAHDIEVVLAVMGPPPTPAQRAAAEELVMTVQVAPYRLEWMPEPWSDVDAAGEWLCRLERQWECDLVHLNGYAHGAAPFRGPKVVVAHSCVLSWWESTRGEPAPPEWDRYRTAVSAGLTAAHRLVAPTRWMAVQLQKYYGVAAPVEVIHNGRSAAEFVPSSKQPFVFAAGRVWDPAKNLQALGRLSARLPWPIRIAGPTTLADSEDATPPQAGFGRAEPLGSLSPAQMAQTYGAASIYALPARYEPFGLSILEAALSGCALVLGNIPTLRELWEDAAVFVELDDSVGLESALLTLIESPAQRNAWARRARSRAGRYTREKMIGKYAALYGRACKQVVAPPEVVTDAGGTVREMEPERGRELPCAS